MGGPETPVAASAQPERFPSCTGTCTCARLPRISSGRNGSVEESAVASWEEGLDGRKGAGLRELREREELR